MDFDEEYARGVISHNAKRIYCVVKDDSTLLIDEIKRRGGFSREEKSKFDAALIELQMKLYITMCGAKQKISDTGEEYGWPSTIFCTVEKFWRKTVFEAAAKMSVKEAVDKITEQIYSINPAADKKRVKKFIEG